MLRTRKRQEGEKNIFVNEFFPGMFQNPITMSNPPSKGVAEIRIIGEYTELVDRECGDEECKESIVGAQVGEGGGGGVNLPIKDSRNKNKNIGEEFLSLVMNVI